MGEQYSGSLRNFSPEGSRCQCPEEGCDRGSQLPQQFFGGHL